MKVALPTRYGKWRSAESYTNGATPADTSSDDVQPMSLTLTVISPHNPWWTILGGVLVFNNLINWKRPQYHTSRLAHDHPLVGVALMLAYAHHFWGDRVKVRSR